MTDIFREVEEDVRRERFEKLWKLYGNYIIILVILLFAGIAAWQVWQRHVLRERLHYSDLLVAAQRITNPQTAANAFVDIARTAPKGYATVARLSEASAMFAAGQRKDAIDLYKQIANSDSGPIGSVARLRAAWALVDSDSRGDLAVLLAPLAQPGNAWRENAEEILAYADYRAMDTKSALAKYSRLAEDPQSPDALRARAGAMMQFLKEGGGADYGSVPPPALAQVPAGGASPPASATAAAPK